MKQKNMKLLSFLKGAKNRRIQTMNGMKLWDVKWKVKTAGPSPHSNDRTELFLLGCKKALEGDPCVGCFNESTWDDSISENKYDPVEMAKHINIHAPNKYITIGGGEPTDQIDNLIILCKELKKLGFHIMVYTWKRLEHVLKNGNGIEEANKTRELLNHIDMLIDGEFVLEDRLYEEDKEDGLLNSIGSGNQIVWDTREFNKESSSINKNINGYKLSDLDALHIKENNMDLVFILKDINTKEQVVNLLK
jgi:organic radical activating enzyme